MRNRCGKAKSASGCWWKAFATTRSSCWMRTAIVLTWNAGAEAHQRLQGERNHRPALLEVLSARCDRKRMARARAAGRAQRRALRGRRLAAAQGRHAVLGQRDDHRFARRRWPPARFRQAHARPVRTQARRGARSRRSAARRDARGRAQRPHRGAAGSAHEGRISRDALARAAHAAERHPRLDADAAPAAHAQRRRIFSAGSR